MSYFIDSSLRILAAMVAGGVVGFNRDLHGKPTGVRLHALVAIGAALFVIAGSDLGEKAAVSRVVQGIVGGVGFLCAGVILHGDGRIRNLTTATSVWVTAGLGVACGVGAWALLAVALVVVLIVLSAGLYIDRHMHGVRDDEIFGVGAGPPGTAKKGDADIVN